MYEGLGERLDQHADHRKAHVLRALCGRLCSGGGESEVKAGERRMWRWRASHGGLERGIEALALLYWLSDAAAILGAPTMWRDAMPASLTAVPACVLAEAEARAAPIVE
eukprot:3740047-Prymnesium_polylepis.2